MCERDEELRKKEEEARKKDEEARRMKEENEKLKLQIEKNGAKNQPLKQKSFDLKCARCEFDFGLCLRESSKFSNYFCFVKKGEQNP